MALVPASLGYEMGPGSVSDPTRTSRDPKARSPPPSERGAQSPSAWCDLVVSDLSSRAPAAYLLLRNPSRGHLVRSFSCRLNVDGITSEQFQSRPQIALTVSRLPRTSMVGPGSPPPQASKASTASAKASRRSPGAWPPRLGEYPEPTSIEVCMADTSSRRDAPMPRCEA